MHSVHIPYCLVTGWNLVLSIFMATKIQGIDSLNLFSLRPNSCHVLISVYSHVNVNRWNTETSLEEYPCPDEWSRAYLRLLCVLVMFQSIMICRWRILSSSNILPGDVYTMLAGYHTANVQQLTNNYNLHFNTTRLATLVYVSVFVSGGWFIISCVIFV